MEYETMTRKELASKLKISKNTLNRRIQKMNPEIRKAVFNKSIFFKNQVKYIYEKVTDMNKKYE
ncbi:helix-turn-helix domain-containing protein [Labilibaculum sp. DW002]|uniref:Helix-turn-helix domain-containing protein n=1 Tax=Paralabilibaculum antarcticum TaxID=2912572 RepID=A0ABT5VUP1_9BACT|nr:winged helix-turn-helix transcriptional regulator [Labilibaculum sp. DW002]MDE5419138.1 helix-turn-helix domain-containing protein [Labilibaculum sp. DW002]